jgi:hypothetical protein
MWTDRRTDMTKVTVAFRNFGNAAKSDVRTVSYLKRRRFEPSRKLCRVKTSIVNKTADRNSNLQTHN